LAQGAKEGADHSIDLWGAGINEFRARSFPSLTRIFLFVRTEVEPKDPVRPLHFFEMRIVEGTREVVPWSRTPLVLTRRPDGRGYVNIINQLTFPTLEAGEGVIETKMDGQPFPSLHYTVMLLGAPSEGGGPTGKPGLN
jgi:hypothetical protein